MADRGEAVYRWSTMHTDRSQQIAVRMTPAMVDALKALAEQQDRPLAWVVRQACAAYLAARAPDS